MIRPDDAKPTAARHAQGFGYEEPAARPGRALQLLRRVLYSVAIICAIFVTLFPFIN